MKKLLRKQSKPKLSIIIVSYNTKEILSNCLASLFAVMNEVSFEVIVSDNASSDGSVKMVEQKYPWANIIANDSNLGFAAANNKARNIARGEYILFLNSDTIVHKNTLKRSISYIKGHSEVGALSVRTLLPNGEDDKDTRRSFPTPWVSLSHFSGLDKIFSKSKLFSRYWYGYVEPDIFQEVDVIQGAFFLTEKNILDKVGWFDEDYFLDGEDIDLCWNIKKLGYKIVYYPQASITHVKKASKKKGKNSYNVVSGVRAMEIFYRKNMWSRYPLIMNLMVIFAIRVLMMVRYIKVKLL